MVLDSLDAQACAVAPAMLDLHARISVNAMQNAATEANLPKQFCDSGEDDSDSDSGENECYKSIAVFGVSVSLLLNTLKVTFELHLMT